MSLNYRKEKYFVYDPEGGRMSYFDSLEEAKEFANQAIQKYLDVDGGYPEAVNVVCGEITHSAQKVDVVMRPPEEEIDEEGIDHSGAYWDADWSYKCNYEINSVN